MPEESIPAAITAATVIKELEAKEAGQPVSQAPNAHESTQDELDEAQRADGETPTDATTETEDESVATTEGESESEEEVVDELDVLVAKAKSGDNAAITRLAQIGKGVDKLQKQLKDAKGEIETAKERVTTLNQWETALGDPRLAPEAIKTLVEYAAQQHGLPLETVLAQVLPFVRAEQALLPEVDANGNKREMFERAGYESKGEYQLALMQQRQDKEIAALRQQLSASQEAQKATERQVQERKYVDGIHPKVVAQAKAEGWEGITKAMIAKAVQEYPQFTSSDLKTQCQLMKKTFPDEFAKARIGLTKQVQGKRGPEALPTNQARGESVSLKTQADILRYSAADAIAHLEQS